MAASTTGIHLRSGSRVLRDGVELLSSMRFAISLLTLICIASVIGTVVRQNEPATNYVNQFGPFWSQLFTTVGLTRVYSAWWFLLILAFLVVSTTLCIVRNAPKILADLRQYKEHVREQSLLSFHHRGEADLAETPEQAFARVSQVLGGRGWRAKVQERREGGEWRGTMIAARKGAVNKLGYIAAHAAIVLICIGGLFDGDLIVRAQMLWQGKTAYNGSGLVRDVPAEHRLGPGTPTFRGNIEVPEGGRRGTAILSQQDGVVLQDLPFDIELKKFIVEYYETGMPKLFASEVVIHDHDSGAAVPATVKVNEPAFHRGVAIYQSSFDDGGSKLKLRALPMAAGEKGFALDGTVGTSGALPLEKDKLTVEFTGLRVITVENMQPTASGIDVRKVDLVDSLQSHLGSGAKARAGKALRNVGASFSYKLRDAAGQAREFNNYMAPVEMDGQRLFLAGVRDTPAESFRYLRIPVDENDGLERWLHLRAALHDPARREAAAQRYGRLAAPLKQPEMAPQLATMTRLALDLFAGALPPAEGQPAIGGLPGLSQYLEVKVPEAERLRISEVMLRVLGGSLYELVNLDRAADGQPPLADTAATQAWMTQALLSLSDSQFYPAPVILELMDYTQVQASVFQVARAPGKTLVYLGCVALIVGVFAMLYVRERRLWIWLQPAQGGGTHLRTAMSTARRTLDADAEFDTLKQALLKGASA
ncbi:cytochrome c biogenesis protein ResB [Rhizobacter sp. Root1221]|uniref:cytochrome c biogenesis protein ResB n=1 Tax=Rhizobacter sp. Root1221 TaxID=1736433 RepID=UPI0006FA3B44|nr:cytochrome c biogenesis protein ResB [Rhizobacter sp. Root1221]KQW01351.1 cytochrome C biogenesis protein ResB [Rhizobacter sp. Root1221]